MKYCRRRTIRRRLAIALPVTAVAAALALTLIFSFTGPKEKPSPDMVAVYISEFTNGVQPIYDDVVSMEGRSELCSALNLSSVMQEILESITALNEELAGVGQDLRLDTVRRYCEEQTERISDIYARCITSFVLD